MVSGHGALWSNWAGQQHCRPEAFADPADEDELVAVVNQAKERGHSVRAVGSGHSFSDLCCTDGCLIDLRLINEVIAIDAAAGTARVGAGITLHDLALALAAEGLALENQGDVDVQTLAGAMATATHGTGVEFANLSSQLLACRLVGADGAIHGIDESDQELLAATRVSLGSLGMMSEVTVRVIPAFRLLKTEEPRDLAQALGGLDGMAQAHDHFELLAFPYSEKCLVLISERTNAAAKPMPRWREVLLQDVLANRTLGFAMRLGRRFPHMTPRIGHSMGDMLPSSQRLDESHRVFPSPRRVRFTEMEYALPAEAAGEALGRIMSLIERRQVPVNFPLELRYVAPDDALLSPANGRHTAYVAVHQYVGVEFEGFFRGVESIFDEYDGRPHWGKRHYQRADSLAGRYPGWDRFQAVRSKLDPEGTFANEHVTRVLGPSVPVVAVA